MCKQRFGYRISGYRWAPESFHVFKGLITQTQRKEIPLSDTERREVGLRFVTQGFRAAVAYVKHIERERECKRRLCVTYGFRIKESPKCYVYCPQLWCRPDAPLLERLHILKTFREQLAADQGRVVQSTECVLDGSCRPTEIKENYVTADLSHPLMVWLRRN